MRYSFATQSVGLESVANCRQLGGYVLPDGSRIKDRLLLRGGAFNKLSPRDEAVLVNDYHLALNFDFRTEGETLHFPDREVSGCKRVWLPAIDPDTESMAKVALPKEAYADLPKYLTSNVNNPFVQHLATHMYMEMVSNEYTQLQYAAFLQTIINTPEGAVYWHCSQGKDRTGLGSAFLLAALGADRELIMEDYLLSAEYYKDDYEKAAAMFATQEERFTMSTFVTVNEKSFVAAFDLIDRRYGSLDNFVADVLLVSDEDRMVLRKRFLE